MDETEAQKLADSIGGRLVPRDEIACNDCGVKIIWVETQDRRKVALDPSATIYVKQPTGFWLKHDQGKKPAYPRHACLHRR